MDMTAQGFVYIVERFKSSLPSFSLEILLSLCLKYSHIERLQFHSLTKFYLVLNIFNKHGLTVILVSMLHKNSSSSSQMRSSHLDSQGVPVQHTPPREPLPHGPAVTCTQLSGGKCQGAASHTRDQVLISHRARSSAHPRAQHGINGLYMSLEVHGGDQTFPWNTHSAGTEECTIMLSKVVMLCFSQSHEADMCSTASVYLFCTSGSSYSVQERNPIQGKQLTIEHVVGD